MGVVSLLSVVCWFKCFVFFFKQKTTYEMRISDWISDVCSSDRQCDVVLIAVVNAQQTIDVLNGPDGVLSQARPDLTIVLLATVPLQDLKQIRELTDAAGVALVDCGVTGGQTVRQNGLVCLVGADEVAFARARPVLDGFAKSVE